MGCESCSFNKMVTHSDGHHYISELESNSCNKLNSYDWMKNLPESADVSNIIEVRFKNTRKEYYRNTKNLILKSGELVAVESSPGYDVGTVALKGILAELQMKKKTREGDGNTLKVIFRRANSYDIKSWQEAKEMEETAMIKARQITQRLNLNMKISDVEYQGDKSKAIFYYIADDRIDFREQIKLFGEAFRVKIEMKQIGARQEAGRVGGIGSCGRELCCSTWRTKLPSVKLVAAQKQNLSANSEKLIGQCGKLKCCLMYELETYLDAGEEIPNELLELETKGGIAYPYKIDVLKRVIWYTYHPDSVGDLFEVPLQKVKDIIMQNKKGEKAEKFEVAKKEVVVGNKY